MALQNSIIVCILNIQQVSRALDQKCLHPSRSTAHFFFFLLFTILLRSLSGFLSQVSSLVKTEFNIFISSHRLQVSLGADPLDHLRVMYPSLKLSVRVFAFVCNGCPMPCSGFSLQVFFFVWCRGGATAQRVIIGGTSSSLLSLSLSLPTVL